MGRMYFPRSGPDEGPRKIELARSLLRGEGIRGRVREGCVEHLAEEDDFVVREVPHPRCETVEEAVLVGAVAAVNSEP